jgi:hypothetical protein
LGRAVSEIMWPVRTPKGTETVPELAAEDGRATSRAAMVNVEPL